MLPSDPVMLLSMVNMKLRDFYPTLDALCKDMDVKRSELEQKLADIDYHYDETLNQFK